MFLESDSDELNLLSSVDKSIQSIHRHIHTYIHTYTCIRYTAEVSSNLAMATLNEHLLNCVETRIFIHSLAMKDAKIAVAVVANTINIPVI
jgi:hypothetical protein